ncbi:hypothetical protein [Fibrobacter sp. UWH6]|uniref:hypothetical protein n=1 Tax=Fibrobacter sp. (strain UWH6) TaxID=1896212 RepID=UPI0009193962|nr:hypothetical protein [Fibrobacter sp. UWH6]SHK16228.1 hypothetical protein SAMN05720765_10179 [Fibrobacter sp. UWH6]
MKKFILTAFSAFMGLTACVYEPEQFDGDSGKKSSTATSDIGNLYPINEGKQICNASVSQDTVNYPGSMLWLNFGGKLNVSAPDSQYTTSGVVQHDRLTVSDTSNTVRWYLMRDTAAGECQFQDPEWSTHANFIVALRAYDKSGSKSCENLDYGIFAARMQDKKKFWFYEKNIGEFATPHVWVSPDAVVDTTADASTIKGFFGTDDVRLVYVNGNNEIVFVDLSSGDLKKAVSKAKTLKKPAGVDGWMMDSPLISPDGRFVVYNVVNSSMNGWNSYVQELSEDSKPIQIPVTEGMMGSPAQPHWFKYGERVFVTWAEFPQGAQFVNKNDLTDVSAQDGSAGRTAMREVSLNAGAPADLQILWGNDIYELTSVPMIGGRSPDGYFLTTGTNRAYVLQLP